MFDPEAQTMTKGEARAVAKFLFELQGNAEDAKNNIEGFNGSDTEAIEDEIDDLAEFFGEF